MQYITDRGAFNRYLYEECHCVNAWQDKEGRRTKYTLARGLGCGPSTAARLRDWRPTTFAKYFGFKKWADLIADCEKAVAYHEARQNLKKGG